jgi:citrate synthase
MGWRIFFGKGEVGMVVKGLEGVVATQSSISSIIDDTLTYVGYGIDELAQFCSFEEVVYLLWHQKLPNKQQLEEIRKELALNASIPSNIIHYLKGIPLNKINPMAVVRTGVSLFSFYDKDADSLDKEALYVKSLKIQAKISTLVAMFSRLRKGLDPISPRKDLGFAANFLYMLSGRVPNEIEEEAFNKALVLHADHELNASTFTARVCVGTLSDVYSGMTAAVGALKGPLHGGANENVMKMLMEIGELDNVESYILEKLERKEKIMGFGHRVYQQGDPRTKHLKEMSRRLCDITGNQKWYEMSVKVEELLAEKKKNLPPNVDFYSATVYHSLGIDSDLFTPIFAVARTSGWLAHIMEQYENNRLIRPRADYTGPDKQAYIPLEQRD